jgi:hypothetical protein
MSLRGGRTSRRSNLLELEKACLTGFSALLEIASGKERPRNDIVSLVGEGTYIFTDPKSAKKKRDRALPPPLSHRGD